MHANDYPFGLPVVLPPRDIRTLRTPTLAEFATAKQFIADTRGHECYICREGLADCGTICDRDQAYGVVAAYELSQPIYPANHWPMMQD